MNTTSSRKKFQNFLWAALLAVGLTAGVSQVGIAATDGSDPASAPMVVYRRAPQDCPRWSDDPAMQQKHAKFLDETRELRKQLTVKQAGMRALLHAAQPDSAQVARLAGELFDLREQLRAKARESGLPFGMMGGCRGGHGMGMGRGDWGPCMGAGPHGGGRFHSGRR